MADREIIREVPANGDGGAMTMIIVLLILFVLGFVIWAFSTGKLGTINPTNPAGNGINIKVDAPKVDIPKLPDVNVTVPTPPTPSQTTAQ